MSTLTIRAVVAIGALALAAPSAALAQQPTLQFDRAATPTVRTWGSRARATRPADRWISSSSAISIRAPDTRPPPTPPERSAGPPSSTSADLLLAEDQEP